MKNETFAVIDSKTLLVCCYNILNQIKRWRSALIENEVLNQQKKKHFFSRKFYTREEAEDIVANDSYIQESVYISYGGMENDVNAILRLAMFSETVNLSINNAYILKYIDENPS